MKYALHFLLITSVLSTIHTFGAEGKTTHLLKRETWWDQLRGPFALTKPTSQRENWSTGLIAEPVATVTNAGFLAVAYKYKDNAPLAAVALASAGIVSAISHAIPLNILNIFDHVAAFASVAAVINDSKMYKSENIKKTLTNPIAVALLATTGLLYGVDVYIPRSSIERQDWHKYIHGAWHLSAALLAETALRLNLPTTK